MNKKFDIISMILIIALTIILIAFVFNYFTDSNDITPATNNLTYKLENIVDVPTVSGSDTIISSNPVQPENEKDVNSTHIIDTIVSGDTSKEEEPSKNIVPNSPLIITSNDNISDKEKKEVLKELDETLMDLLDVIETVQTVDESRLPTDGNEVEP